MQEKRSQATDWRNSETGSHRQFIPATDGDMHGLDGNLSYGS
jgi:hypothetical protein